MRASQCNKTRFFLWYIFIFLLCIPILFAIYSAVSVASESENKSTSSVNWKEIYPFAESENTTESQENSHERKLVWILRKYKNGFSKMNSIWDIMPKDDSLYKGASQIGLWMNSKLSDINSSSEYVMLKNGLWTEKKSKVAESKFDIYATDVVDLSEYLSNKDIDLIYVIPPGKNCKYESLLPYGTEDYSNDNLDTLRTKLEDNNITVLDLRDVLHSEGMKHEDMFYISDHHWNVETGKWAAQKVASYMNRELDAELELEQLENGDFYIEDYGDIQFGSVGNTLGRSIVSPDDFSILFPEFKTNFDMSIPGINLNKSGSFYDVFVNHESLNKIKSKPGSAYGTLLYGNNAVTIISNKETENDKKVLMLKDSFSLAMAPYFSLTCKELTMLDLRPALNGFDGSVHSFIEEHNPDYVIVMYGYPIDRDFQ